VVQQEQKDRRKVENTGLINRHPEMTFQKIMVTMSHSLSNLASSNDGEDREIEDDEETELSLLSKHDEPCNMMGIISTSVQQRMERIQLQQIRHAELTQPQYTDAADNCSKIDKKYSISGLMIPAVNT
jgi:hypothetical protein